MEIEKVFNPKMSKIPQCVKKTLGVTVLCFEQSKQSPEGGMEMTKVKVAIADDNRELLKTMEHYFQGHPEIEIIATVLEWESMSSNA